MLGLRQNVSAVHQYAAMRAASFTAAQLDGLRTLHRTLEADVTDAVHEPALRVRLLQLIAARFNNFEDGDHGDSATQQADDREQKHEQDDDCEQKRDEATLDGQQQQRQDEDEAKAGRRTDKDQLARPAELTSHSPATEAASSMKSKRRKKKDSGTASSHSTATVGASLSDSRTPTTATTHTPATAPTTTQPNQQDSHSDTQQPLFLTTPSPSAERDVDLLPTLDAPVRLDHNSHSGRLVRATTPLSAGMRVMDDRGYAAVIKLERCKEVCALCHSLIDDSARLSCSECRVAHYCSARCQHVDAEYRHATECRMLAAVGQLSRSMSVDADLLQLLAAVCARHYREKHREQYPSSSSNSELKSTGSGMRQEQHQQQTGLNDSATDEQVQAARWRDDELVSPLLASTHTVTHWVSTGLR